MGMKASKVHYRGTPFTATLGDGEDAKEITPTVCDLPGNSYGLALEINGEVSLFLGGGDSADLVTGWRTGEILSRLTCIDLSMLMFAHHAAQRGSEKEEGGPATWVKEVIGEERYAQIMQLPVPDEIIQAILDGQSGDVKPGLDPITGEVRARTVVWWPEFNAAGIKHPDQEDADARAAAQFLTECRELLDDYARVVGEPPQSLRMECARAALVRFLESGASSPRDVLVAAAGTIGALGKTLEAYPLLPAMGDMGILLLKRKVDAAVLQSAKWVHQRNKRKVLGFLSVPTASVEEWGETLLSHCYAIGMPKIPDPLNPEPEQEPEN